MTWLSNMLQELRLSPSNKFLRVYEYIDSITEFEFVDLLTL